MVLLGSLGVVSNEMPEEALQRGQPAVPRAYPVATLILEVPQEVRDALNVEVNQTQIRHPPAKNISGEVQVEPQRIPIGSHGVSARTANLTKVLQEE
jgi:hypothetical protein